MALTEQPTSLAVLPIVSMVISALFLVALPVRLYSIYHADIKLAPSWMAPVKSVLAITTSADLVATMVVYVRHISLQEHASLSIAALAMSSVASAGLCWLLFVDHRRSVRPSTLGLSYALASIICESIWIAAPGKFALRNDQLLRRLFTAQLCLKFVLVLLESRGKTAHLYPQYRDLSPEETSGIIRGALFWWINPLLSQGASKILTDSDLPAVQTSLSSERLWRAMVQSWRKRASHEGRMTLFLALLRCLAVPVMCTVPFRLLVLLFQYAQPALIRQTIVFVTQNKTKETSSAIGFWIIVTACFVYIGLAFSTAMYQHQLNNLRVMARGALVGLLYTRIFEVRSDVPETGAAVTLMSSDVDSLSGAIQLFLDLFGYGLGVIIGMVMLWREIGWLSILPLILIFFGTRVSRYVAQNLRTKQRDASGATQKRIAAISSMLSSMKAIKALGLSDIIASRIRDLRSEEIAKTNTIRWMMLVYKASANALGLFTPAITIALYAITGDGSLNVETAFTTVALLTMVMHPANMVMTIVPNIVASFASFDRVQAYLLESTRHDPRGVPREGEVRLEHASVVAYKTTESVLKDMNLEIHSPSIIAIIGPVGSGKSLFAKLLLGEVSSQQGVVTMPTQRIGLCAQSPWLPDGTIQNVICNFESEVDPLWYDKVVSSCCLTHDLATLQDGDSTIVGTRGMNLSGGQRQRVALARLLYARCRVVIMDDILSSLDKKTGDTIIHNLLGPDGLLRQLGCTVFWLGNSAAYSHLADKILVLESGELKERSTDGLPVNQTQRSDDEQGDTEPIMALTEPPQSVSKLQSQKRARENAAADLSRKTGDLTLYGAYFRQAGIFNSLLMVASTAVYSFFVMFPQYWLKLWTESGTQNAVFYTVGYIVIAFLAWVTTCCSIWCASLLMAPTSGRRLHQMLLGIVIGAPLSFFSENDIGVTLNRFSQDIQLIDSELAEASSSLSVQVMKLLVQIGLLVAVQKLLLFTLPVCAAIVYIVQKVYLQTSRQLRFLDLESKSAVFSSFIETVDGVVTIRAFGWEQQAMNRTIASLDKSQRAAYTLFCLQRWLSLVLDLIVAGIAIGLIALAVVWRDNTTGGAIGVALNIVLVTNTTLLGLVRFWTTLEISLSAISRLRILQRETPAEAQSWEDQTPLDNWPLSGGLDIQSVDASYNSGAKVLKDISLSISPGQKVLLCGRTGSGKSTLLLVLLRLVENTGVVKIDGFDLARLSREHIRQRCFITITQDPFVIQNYTLRFNLDPEMVASDKLLVRALKSVQLWALLSSQDTRDTTSMLDAELSSLPVLSAGQSQLLALARAIVKAETLRLRWGSTPVVLLDEATSSLDAVIDDIVHEVMDREFTGKGHTVIMITHRPLVAAKRMRWGRDLVVGLKNGRIYQMGDTEEILRSM